jgi:hypothetical protein
LQANSDLLDRAASFLSGAEEGEQASEFLLVLAFGVLPIAEATRRLATVLQEYVGFEMAILSSPFF